MSKQVVVVEADSFRLQGITNYLTDILNHQARFTADTRTGWFLITEAPPDVVIIGILSTNTLPNHTEVQEPPGLALAKEIKQLFPSMGVILFSSGNHVFKQHIGLLRHRYGDSVQSMTPTDDITHLEELLGRIAQERASTPSPPMLDERERRRLATHLWAMLGDLERPWIEATLLQMPQLSSREWQLITLLGQSLSAQGIAQKLDISRNSVDNAISRIYSKLGLSKIRQEAPELRAMLILIKANTLYTLKRTDSS